MPRSFEGVCWNLALHLAESTLYDVEMGGRLDGDRGQRCCGSLLLLRWWLWILSRRDGLVGHWQVTSWAGVSPLSFIFTILPEERIERTESGIQNDRGYKSASYRSYRIGSVGVALSLNTLAGESWVSRA